MRHRLLTVGLAAGLITPLVGGPAWSGPDSMTRLSHDAANPLQDIRNPVVTPDSSTVVFRSDHDADGTYRLFAAPIEGGTLTDLTPTVAGGGDGATHFKITPDGSRAVFRGDIAVADRFDLFSVPIDGSADPIRLNDLPTHSDGNGGDIYSDNAGFRLTPDGQRAVFIADLDVDARVELYSVPLDAQDQQIKVSTTSPGAGDIGTDHFVITPDSTRVIYKGDLATTGHTEVWSALVDAEGTQIQLSTTAAHDTFASEMLVTPDSTRVVFNGDFLDDGRMELFSAPVDVPGQQLQLNTTPAHAGDLTYPPIRLTPDGTRVVFYGDLETLGKRELFSAPVDTTGGQIRISESQPGGEVEFGFTIATDGSHVVYTGDLTTEGVEELYAARVDTADTQVRLNAPPIGTGDVSGFYLPPSNGTVVFYGNLEADNRYEVFRTSIDSPGTQVKLSPDPSHAEFMFLSPRLSPDGRRVVYEGDLEVDERHELFSTPLDAPGTATKLNDIPVAGGETDGLVTFAPDSSRVVFLGDLATDETFELWSTGRGQLPPPPVTMAIASAVGDSEATLTWDAPDTTGAVDAFTVTLDPAPPSAPSRQGAAAVSQSTTDTTITLTGLAPETTYTATITADNDGGASTGVAVEFTTLAPDAVNRLSGADRYETAVQVALDRFDPDDVDTVYLAVGTNFPDALAGGPLAAQEGAPILLVRTDSLPLSVGDALEALAPSKVIAFGGAKAISPAVLDAAAAAAGGASTDRISGIDRYATAAAISAELDTAGIDTAYLATGTNFPDALAGGPATDGAPILLTRPDALPDATSIALGQLAPDTVVALGGPAAVTNATLGEAASAAGPTATTARLSGANRFSTAAAIAGEFGEIDTAYVAVGTNFPDALAAGPAAAAEGAPIVLVRSSVLPESTSDYLDGLTGLRRIVILGGTGAVDVSVENALTALLD